ncbi:DUF4126 domain-containing protein [Kiloniella laminariae]|uniref:DUF4126 domain-containing protein n=1 Tax=Kiloniella laminariae TaxID=454162 RepID=A0ABT4LP41_9PROT|nr:DUF4126 domain-containing protein [Kiloniella laminariae]MCZ4282908.1 DUF4126 domain-containing protein [Kiloniella laminariae]
MILSLFEILVLSSALAWASGINLYATLAFLGILGASGQMDLPGNLAFVQHPAVIMIAVFLYFIEFIVDKIPAVDSIWDAVHTFIRIPAGALLAAGLFSDAGGEAQTLAFLLGGGLASVSHLVKSGSRAVLNTSPEPVTNIVASVVEDIVVIGGLVMAFMSPSIFAAFLALFLLLAIWLLPKVYRGLRGMFRFISGRSGENRTKHGNGGATRPSGDEVFPKQEKRSLRLRGKPGKGNNGFLK